MSYILDALRRSQAERERDRGQVPGLNAQPAPADTAARPARAPAAWWLAAAAGALLLLGVLLWLLQRDAVQPAPPAVAAMPAPATTPAGATPGRVAAPAVVAAPGVAPVAAPLPAPTGTVSPNTVSRSTPSPSTPSPSTPLSNTAPFGTAPSGLPIVVSAPPAPAVTTGAPPPVARAPLAPPAAASAAAEPRPIALAQLSAEQRRDLPALVVGGSIWSQSAASRFVILNGVIVREGEAVAPGLTLERIHPKSAVLRWRDIRIELAL